MKKGLYRIELPGQGEYVRTHLSAGDAAPFLERDAYEALSFQPPYDALPSKEEYLSRTTRSRIPEGRFEWILPGLN